MCIEIKLTAEDELPINNKSLRLPNNLL